MRKEKTIESWVKIETLIRKHKKKNNEKDIQLRFYKNRVANFVFERLVYGLQELLSI